MKKNSASQKINLMFSAFLVFAYTVCTYFIDSFSSNIANPVLKSAFPLILFVVFGLFLFYATRVGDGKPVYRFSLSVLIFMVIPGLYIILASVFEALPLHEQFIQYGSNMAKIAAAALGYGLPYMFISGFELDTKDKNDEIEIFDVPVNYEEKEISEDITTDDAESDITEENTNNNEEDISDSYNSEKEISE